MLRSRFLTPTPELPLPHFFRWSTSFNVHLIPFCEVRTLLFFSLGTEEGLLTSVPTSPLHRFLTLADGQGIRNPSVRAGRSLNFDGSPLRSPMNLLPLCEVDFRSSFSLPVMDSLSATEPSLALVADPLRLHAVSHTFPKEPLSLSEIQWLWDSQAPRLPIDQFFSPARFQE